jgi:hypothetical protein
MNLRTVRVILFACMIFALAGSAFAGGSGNDNSSGDNNIQGGPYKAPELDFKGPLKYELLVIAGAGVLLLERRRRRRRALLDK